MSSATQTVDHSTIKKWVDSRDGFPAVVSETASAEGSGLLRIGFDERDDALEQISWDKFFEVFESENLSFLYQEKVDGGSQSRFCKFVARESN